MACALAGLGAFGLLPGSAGRLIAQEQAPPPGVVRAGDYRASVVGGGTPTPVTLPMGGSVYDAGPFPLVTPELALGEDRDVTLGLCSVCHSLRYITMQPPLPAATWRAVVR